MKKYIIGFSAIAMSIIVFWFWLGTVGIDIKMGHRIIFPFSLANIGPNLVEYGVIDPEKYSSPYMAKQYSRMEIDEDNGKDMLNMLWAFGLANKNEVLDKRPMMDPKFGGPGQFASVGGWTIGVGSPLSYYSMHNMVVLDSNQQDKVNSVSKKIFRPCCPNPAYFPDCNHGMAMLGLLEMMAYNGMDEEKMETYAHEVNKIWFPQLRNNASCTV